jgi:hypothetical protein
VHESRSLPAARKKFPRQAANPGEGLLHSRAPLPKSVNHRRGASDRQTASADSILLSIPLACV